MSGRRRLVDRGAVAVGIDPDLAGLDLLRLRNREGQDPIGEAGLRLVTLDADLNHQPEEIPRLLESALGQGCDVLVGSRFLEGSAVVGTPVPDELVVRLLDPAVPAGDDLRVVDQTRHGNKQAGQGGGSNFAFCDGSVRYLRFGQSVSPRNLWATTDEWRSVLEAALAGRDALAVLDDETGEGAIDAEGRTTSPAARRPPSPCGSRRWRGWTS